MVFIPVQNFSVPLKEPNRSKWINSIEKFQPFDYVVQTYHLCSLHFLQNDIVTKGKRKTIICGRVPTIFPNNPTDDINTNLQSGDVNSSFSVVHCDPTIEKTPHSIVEINRPEFANANDAAELSIVTNDVLDVENDMTQCELDSMPSIVSDSYDFLHENHSNISHSTSIYDDKST